MRVPELDRFVFRRVGLSGASFKRLRLDEDVRDDVCRLIAAAFFFSSILASFANASRFSNCTTIKR